MTDAIVLDGVSKSFRLAVDPMRSIKERMLRLGRRGHEEFRALAPLDLTIATGDTVGILGHNGSGKSTLLKCVAGIITPTTGSIRLRGRLASLLELGAGFHPELTGRENVYINAAFLGISRKEIGKRFDDIVAFSELEQFIDEPVKHYSSGMYVRLGFAVAVNVEPDILLVDEVLAVGDEVFQKKCINRVRQFQREGRTIVFVTHAADIVREVCDRAIVLDHGLLVADAKPPEAIRIFREHLHGQLVDHDEGRVPTEDSPARIVDVSIDPPTTSEERRYFYSGEGAMITVVVDVDHPVDDAVLEVELTDDEGKVLFATDTDRLGTALPVIDRPTRLEVRIGSLPLLDGEYPVNVRLSDRTHGRLLDWREGQHSIEVVNPTRSAGLVAIPIAIEASDRRPASSADHDTG